MGLVGAPEFIVYLPRSELDCKLDIELLVGPRLMFVDEFPPTSLTLFLAI